ncbi:pentatricopeptide repeat-containing protein At1g63150-like [Trifolium pratense]|uniref:pentatricopeptide repeat-containing protein At1g63150-like n=1 Tax=Trifolium pratense TaxID=57577 RepID=UPI001E69007F|nr:pentatricopeptide repeat-containing protein At1g63150-like [Trifolium pratense]
MRFRKHCTFMMILSLRDFSWTMLVTGHLINGLCKMGHTTPALQLLTRLEKGSVKPDVMMYNTIIDSMCKDKLVDDACQLFSEMVIKGISPTVVTYSALIYGFCIVSQLKQDRNANNRMLQMRNTPSIIEFTKILGSLVKTKNNYSTVISLSHQMEFHGIRSDIFTITILINCYCHIGQMTCAFSLLGKILKMGYQLDVVTVNTLIKGLCLNNEVQKALYFHDDLIAKSVFG